MLDELARLTDVRTAKGVAQAVSGMVSTGQLEAGSQLPTVRTVARHLGISPSTVSEAWQLLAGRGLIETAGRRGSFIRDRPPPQSQRRFRHVTGSNLPLDLSTGYPDPDLLPDVRPLLARLAEGPAFTGYPDHEIDLALDDLLDGVLPPGRRWARTLVPDYLSALAELLPVVGGYGTPVVVARAHFAPDLDLIERFGQVPVPVPMDDEGPDLAGVTSALEQGAGVVMLQPSVHNPTGLVTSPGRLEQLARACASHGAWIIENDYFGGLAQQPVTTAASWSERTVHVRSFAKELHPDLRVCVVAGPDDLIERVRRRRAGGGWVSRVNQDLLRLMLTSPETHIAVSRARKVYAGRRQLLLDELASHGVQLHSKEGFNLWVPVASERAALMSLAAHGISVAPGSAFVVDSALGDHIRLSVASLRTGGPTVAAHVATASRAHFSSRAGSGG